MTPLAATRSHALIERSLRRSAVRTRVLLHLAKLGRAYAAQLAREAGIDARRLKMALEGRPPAYTPDAGLLALGLVRRERGAAGVHLVLTAKGRDALALARRIADERGG